MTREQLIQKYIDFFKSKKHLEITNAPLIPENDPTVLFTTAGMHPLVPYLMGEDHPSGNRLVNVQKCIRTVDIDNVGDATHHTLFEMLGNWSLGDYFKKEAIEFSWEFLTSEKWLGLDKNRLAVSVFAGNDKASLDEESLNIWKNLGINKKRIAELKDNWWGPAGQTGPCGPDTEMFYWVGDVNNIPESFNDDNDQWVEIWNNVFLQYNKVSEKEFQTLKQKNVDTGLGLDRVLAIVNNLDDNYNTELFQPLISEIQKLSGIKYDKSSLATCSMRIIADHIRASVFIVAEYVSPSNLDQGYVLRKLLRRAIRHGKLLGIQENVDLIKKLSKVVIGQYKKFYPRLSKNESRILQELGAEEVQFEKTLDKGLKEFNKLSLDQKISGKEAFKLFSTYGFPAEMIKEMCVEKKVKFEESAFNQEMKKHQELSRTASSGKFKGGLADASEISKKYHTATHLLQAALRKVLGDQVQQRGSNINSERMRFDFSYSEKMTSEQIREVEDLVNEIIARELQVTCEITDVKNAKQAGAIGLFTDKYGDMVKVYSIGQSDRLFSLEVCGGPHVDNTRELGKLKIIKESSISAGIRRIKAKLINE